MRLLSTNSRASAYSCRARRAFALLLCAAVLAPLLAAPAVFESRSASASAAHAPGGVTAASSPLPSQESLPAAADTWTRVGPIGGRITGLGVSPANPSTVYAAVDSESGEFVPFGNGARTYDGVYKSTDGGATWAVTGLSGRTLHTVAVDPTDANVVYAGGFRSGVYKSVDGGANWSGPHRQPNALEADAFALAVHPQTPATLYVSFAGHGLHRSTNGGVNWAPVSGLGFFGILRVSFDPQNPSTVYAAGGHAASFGVYKSTDGGANWSRMSAGLPPTEMTSAVAVDPANPSVLYVGGQTNGVFKSVNGGAAWAAGNAGLPSAAVHELAVNPAGPSVLVAATDRGIYKTADGGAAWAASAGLDQPVLSLAALPGNAAALLAGTRGLGVFKSADAGASWSGSGAGLPSHSINRLAVSTADAARVYAATDDGLYQTFDRGDNWSVTGLGGRVRALAIDPLTPTTLYAGIEFFSVQKSTDGGATWPIVQLRNSPVAVVAVDPSTPSTVYWSFEPVSLFKSTTGGAQFAQISSPGSVFALAVDPTNSRNVYAGSDLGVAKSINGGQSWSTITLRPAAQSNPHVTSLTIDPNNHSTVYATTFKEGAHRSTDGGQTWQPVFADAAGTVLSVAVAPGNPSVVFAGTTEGVYKSTNAGASSAPFGEGMPPATRVNVLAFDTAGRHLYAGTHAGVFRLESSPCGYLPAPAGQSLPTAGGAGAFNVTVSGANCSLTTAAANVDWITITSVAPGAGGAVSVSYSVAPNTGNRRGGVITVGNQTFNVTQAEAPATFLFGAAGHTTGEGEAAGAPLTVTRRGDNTFPAWVNFSTVDDPAAVPCAERGGAAYARCDYATTIDTVFFGPGETSKVVRIPLVDDGHVENTETFSVTLSQPSEGASLGPQASTVVSITDDDTASTPNPVYGNGFFVRQQYLDFLSREPEPAGFDAWKGLLDRCPNVNDDPACDRTLVSSSFFLSAEFQLKGFFVYNFYKVAFGRLPLYAEITPDMRSVSGQTADEVFFKRFAYTESFTQRPEFKAAFDAKTNAEFVNTLAGRYGIQQITTPDLFDPEGDRKVTLTTAELTARLDANLHNRTQVLRAFVQSDEVNRAEFDRAFVAMQYFGYLRRDPEEPGYSNWLNYLAAHPGDYRTMVGGFVNSVEYVLRFGQR